MTRLLKAATVDAAIRSLPMRAAAPQAAIPMVDDPVRSLHNRISELEAELAEVAAALPVQLEKTREEGRLAGLKERDQNAIERLRLLERATSSAVSDWVSQLARSHGLAIEISRTVLARMIGRPEWRSELVQAAITDRLAVLDARSLISVRVSGDDFAEAELGQISPEPTARVVIDPDLKSGDCVIDLAMGQVEVGPEAQWRRVASLLDDIAGAPC